MSTKSISAKATTVQKEGIRICGLNLVQFFVCAVILFVSAQIGVMPSGVLYVIMAAMIIGEALNFIGDRIPIFNTYLGGGIILALFGSSALKYFGLLPVGITETLGKHVLTSGGLFDLFIVPLIVGSILGMNRKLLLNAGLRYLIPIAGGIVTSFVGTGIIGVLTGYGFKKAVLFIAAPIMGGGVGAGAMPMADIYANAGLGAQDEIFSVLMVALTLGNAFAVICASVLNGLGKKHPSLTGDGELMQGFNQGESKKSFDGSIILNNITPGIIISGSLYLIARMTSKVIPLHAYAILVILTIGVKLGGVFSEEIEDKVNTFYVLLVKGYVLLLITAAGVGLFDFSAILSSFSNPIFVILALSTIVFAAIGSGLSGKLVNFFFVESAITAGLCMANMGGSGDIAVLASSKRLSLMPFAAISSRIGGAIMLLLMGVITSLV